MRKSEVVQAAVAAGFDFNGAVNGLAISTEKHNTGGHKKYNTNILLRLTEWASTNKGFTPEDAKKFLEQTLMPELKAKVRMATKID